MHTITATMIPLTSSKRRGSGAQPRLCAHSIPASPRQARTSPLYSSSIAAQSCWLSDGSTRDSGSSTVDVSTFGAVAPTTAPSSRPAPDTPTATLGSANLLPDSVRITALIRRLAGPVSSRASHGASGWDSRVSLPVPGGSGWPAAQRGARTVPPAAALPAGGAGEASLRRPTAGLSRAFIAPQHDQRAAPAHDGRWQLRGAAGTVYFPPATQRRESLDIISSSRQATAQNPKGDQYRPQPGPGCWAWQPDNLDEEGPRAARRPQRTALDRPQLAPAIERAHRCTGRVPGTVTADRGYGQPADSGGPRYSASMSHGVWRAGLRACSHERGQLHHELIFASTFTFALDLTDLVMGDSIRDAALSRRDTATK